MVAIKVARAVRWTALLLQNVSAALQATAHQIEAELQASLPRDRDMQIPIHTPADIRRAAAAVPPGEYDDHPPVDLGVDDLIRNDE